MNNLEQYEAMVPELIRLSAHPAGSNGSWLEMQACAVLTKIGLTALSSLYFIPGSSRFNGELWDISTLATLSRSIFETYCILHYFTDEGISEEEQELRQLAWRHHEKREQIKMLEWHNPASVYISEVQEKKAELEKRISDKEPEKKLFNRATNDKNGLLKSKFDICKDAGINERFYLSTYKWLCSFTHPTPFGINFLHNNHAGGDKAEELIDIVVQITTGFMAFSIRDFLKTFPDQKESIHPAIPEIIDDWEFRFSNWESDYD